MCDKVRNPEVQVPRAIIGTVLLNTIAGLLFLIPVVAVLPDMQILIEESSSQPVPVIVLSAVANPIGTFCLLFPLIVLALLFGIACTAAASRCTWAFARDGDIQGAKLLGLVDRNFKVPLNAMMLSKATQIFLDCIYFGSETAFNAFSSAGVIFLTVSYAIPIAASLFGGRKDIKKGKFSLGKLGVFCNIVSLCMLPLLKPLLILSPPFSVLTICLGWSAFAIPLFCMPSYLPVTAETINYAYAFAVFAGL
jgi:amino acid transporter